MQPCWLWTPSRSSTVDFPTLGNQNICLLSLSKPFCCSTFCTQTEPENIICPGCFLCVKLLKCDTLSSEQFHFHAIRCLQDAEVLLKLTEEVNATLRNKVSAFSFLSLMFSFSWTCKDAHLSSLTDDCTHADALTSLFLFPSCIPLSFQASVNTELVRCLSRTARGILPPLAAAVGGLASQEVLKAITGKFAPLQQWVGCWIYTVDTFSEVKWCLLIIQ